MLSLLPDILEYSEDKVFPNYTANLRNVDFKGIVRPYGPIPTDSSER